MISVFGHTIRKNEKLEELQSQKKKSLELLNKKDKWIADLLNETLGYFLPYADHPLSMAESKEWCKILSHNIRLANSYIEERKKELNHD